MHVDRSTGGSQDVEPSPSVRRGRARSEAVLVSGLEAIEGGFLISIGHDAGRTDHVQSLADHGWVGISFPRPPFPPSPADAEVSLSGLLVADCGPDDRPPAGAAEGAPTLDLSASSPFEVLERSGQLPAQVHLLALTAGSRLAIPVASAVDRLNPWVVLVSSDGPTSDQEAGEWHGLLTRRGYKLCSDDDRYDVYVSADHSELDFAFLGGETEGLAGASDGLPVPARSVGVPSAGHDISGRSLWRELARENVRLRREQQQVLSRLEHLVADRDFYRVAHSRLKTSLSWRMTAPLRQIGRALDQVQARTPKVDPHARFILLPPLAIGQGPAAQIPRTHPASLPNEAAWVFDRLNGQSD